MCEYLKKQDLLGRIDYLSLSTLEYKDHCNRNTDFTPNQPSSYLDTKCDEKHHKIENVPVFLNLTSILHTIVDEYIILYKNPNKRSHIYDKTIQQCCWDFLKRRDKKIWADYNTQFSSKSQRHLKLVGFILYCQLRALFRKNCTIFKFGFSDLPKWIFSRCKYLSAIKTESKLSQFKDKVTSLRAQLNHIWIPLLQIGN